MIHDRPIAEINVINLVDVMLVLLVLFIITAPLLRGGIDVELPETRAARPLESATGILVTVTETDQILVDGEEIEKAKLVDEIRARRGDLGAEVYLAGDRGVDYGEVVSVLGLLTDAGVSAVGLVAEPARRRRN